MLEKYGIKLYNSIETMPITRHLAFNKYLMLEAGIGGDINDFFERIGAIQQYINNDLKDEAIKEVHNMAMNVSFMMESLNPSNHAFICLIKEIDGDEIGEIDDDKIDEILKVLSKKGLTVEERDENISEVKKK